MKTTIPFMTPLILGVILIALRATGVINWEWWIVLTPFWLPVAIYSAIAVIIVVWYAVTGGSKYK